MATIDSITLEVADVAAAERFYAAAFDVGDLLRLRASDAPTDGFRGFTVSLVVSQPSGVDALVARARDAGATVLQEPTKSLWGYGGSVQAPDGTIWTVASSSKKESGPPDGPRVHLEEELRAHLRRARGRARDGDAEQA